MATRPDEARLDSWKAIAVYLNRDVRTVQRWEAREGLPVHRLQHDRLASVYAWAPEIDAWVARRSVGPRRLTELSTTAGIDADASIVNAAAAPLRLERRDVAILVLSIARPGQLADERGPDAVGRDLSALNEALAVCRESHRAHVLARFGDHAVLAFGLAGAEEDDGVRAARAADSMRQTAASTRIPLTGGLAFGPVLTAASPDGRISPTGTVVDEARLLAAHAGDGEVLLGQGVTRLVDPFFETVEKPPLQAGGRLLAIRRLGAPVPVPSRFAAAVRRGLTSFVGRTAEIDRLRAAWGATCTRGGRVLHLLGEAGMGKSRLLLEFRRAVNEGGPAFATGRSAAQGRPYLPLVEAFAELTGLVAGTADEASVTAGVQAIDPSLETFVPQYLHLLGIASTSYALPAYLQGLELKIALREALSAAFVAAAARRPLALLLEDWHWADEGSVDVLRQLAQDAGPVPLLVLVTSRSEGLSPDAVPAGVETLTLEPLSPAETGTLVQALVDGPIAPEFIHQVHARTGGNPFFVEELCDSLHDQGRDASDLDGLQLPSTVQAVIRARIDRLGTDDREVLRTAAVVGRECTREVLGRLLPDPAPLDASLRRLLGARILQALRTGREPTFRFKHSLTQEVAYLSMPAFERKALHGRLAELLCDLHATQVDRHADVLAFHFNRSESWARATEFALRAARRAFALTQFGHAVDLLEQAQRSYTRLAAAEQDPRLLGEILLLEERASEPMGDRNQQEQLLSRALQALEDSPHRDLLAEALVRLGDLRSIQGRFEEARPLISRALELCQATGYRAVERSAWRALGFSEWRRGQEAEAITCNQRALAIARSIDDRDGIATDLTSIAAVLRAQGRHAEALDHLADAEAVEGLSPVAASYVYQVTSSVLASLGEAARAADVLEHVMNDIQIPGGVPIHRVFSVLSLARLRLDAGDTAAAEQLFEECVGRCRELHYAHGLSMTLPGLADTHARTRRWPEAAACLEEALAIFDRLHETEGVIDHWEQLAWVRVQLGEWARAIDAAGRAAETAQRLGFTSRGLAAFERLARGLREAGAPATDVRGTLERALQLAVKAADEPARGRNLNTLGIVEFTEGRFARARQHFEQACEIFRRNGPPAALALMLNALGATLRALGRRHEAIRQLEASLDALDGSDESRLRGHAMALLGDIYRDLGEPDTARSWYERSLDVRVEAHDPDGQAWMFQRLSLLHLDAGLVELAREELTQARGLMTADATASLREAVDTLTSQLSQS
ncbi:MAG: tetratricopeptide repeat protein [Vicinamibacterales bacterium]